MRANDPLSAIHNQIMWNRLIAVVEEQAQTLLRTAFSTAVREAGDLSAGVFDPQGRMIAQAVTGTPGHVNSMALAVGHFLARYPAETMEEGDVYLTNDPWLSTGHLFDFTVVSPAFHHGKLVGLFASTAHVVDIGGAGFTGDCRQVYEEGLCIPVMPMAKRGVMSEALFDIIAINVREPVQVRGDLYSLASCNEIGARRLSAMMDEFELPDLSRLADFIFHNSHDAMLSAIRALPAGTYRHSMTADGYEAKVEIVAEMTISADGIKVDFTGTTPASAYGINVPICYTEAYTAFGVRCLVGPTVLNNHASLALVTATAPVGTILNAPRPHAVNARHVVGQMLPDVVFGCLHQALAEGAPAEGSASLWVMPVHSAPGLIEGAGNPNSSRFTISNIMAGGTGARPTKDGMSGTAFPSRVKCVPVEITETISPLVFWRKELRADSGGAGQHRGGLGQIIEVGNQEDAPFRFSPATWDRVIYPARGREGGGPGEKGRFSLGSGKQLGGKERQMVPAGDRLVIELPGGGGYGDPKLRDPAALARDVRLGLITQAAAERDYGKAT